MNAQCLLLGCFPPWIYRDGNFYWQGDLQTISLPCSINQIEFNIYQSETNSVRINPSPKFVSFELQSPYEVRTRLFNLLVLQRPGCGAIPDTFHIPHGNHPLSLCTASAGNRSYSSGQSWLQDCQATCLWDWLLFWGFLWHLERQTLYKTGVTCSITIVTNVGFTEWCHCSSKLLCEKAARETSPPSSACMSLTSFNHTPPGKALEVFVCFLFIEFFCLAFF